MDLGDDVARFDGVTVIRAEADVAFRIEAAEDFFDDRQAGEDPFSFDEEAGRAALVGGKDRSPRDPDAAGRRRELPTLMWTLAYTPNSLRSDCGD